VARVARAAPLVSAASTRTLCPPWRCALGIFCLFCSGSGCGDHLGLVGLGRSSAVCGFGFRVEMHHHGRACALLRQCVCGCAVPTLACVALPAASRLGASLCVGLFVSRPPSSPSTRPVRAVVHWWRVLTPPSPPNPLLWPAVACVWADGRWSDLRAGHRGACAVHGPLPPRSCRARQAGGAPAHRCRAQGVAAHGRVDECVLLCVSARVSHWSGVGAVDASGVRVRFVARARLKVPVGGAWYFLRFHSTSLARAQGIPKYKAGLGRGKSGKVCIHGATHVEGVPYVTGVVIPL
jgi:hypothetical protein